MTQARPAMASTLRIICAMLLLSLGIVHRPPPSPQLTAALDSAYRLPDGSFSDLCLGNDHHPAGAAGHHPLSAALVCDACVLAASLLLPPPGDCAWLRADLAWIDNRPVTATGIDSHPAGGRPRVRGPPPVA